MLKVTRGSYTARISTQVVLSAVDTVLSLRKTATNESKFSVSRCSEVVFTIVPRQSLSSQEYGSLHKPIFADASHPGGDKYNLQTVYMRGGINEYRSGQKFINPCIPGSLLAMLLQYGLPLDFAAATVTSLQVACSRCAPHMSEDKIVRHGYGLPVCRGLLVLNRTQRFCQWVRKSFLRLPISQPQDFFPRADPLVFPGAALA